MEGKPDHIMKAGDAHWHGGKVVSAVPLRLLGVMIVEKDKPILEMKR